MAVADVAVKVRKELFMETVEGGGGAEGAREEEGRERGEGCGGGLSSGEVAFWRDLLGAHLGVSGEDSLVAGPSVSICLYFSLALSSSHSLSLFLVLFLFLSVSLTHTHTHKHTLTLALTHM